MSRVSLYVCLLLWLGSCETKPVKKPTILYTSPHFTVYADSVTQGTQAAVAVSDSEITSTYQSPANQTFSRRLTFRFSLNGRDNEGPPGAEHQLMLYPKDGRVVSPIFTFGQPDTTRTDEPANDFLEPNTSLQLRLDLRPVLEAFRDRGYYLTYNGNRLYQKDFKCVYVAGNAAPLTWDFDGLASRPDLQLKDPDGDGIYEVTLMINPYRPEPGKVMHWKLSKDLRGLPRYHSPQRLTNALYNLSLEEMLQDIRPDGTFMAGAQWEGVWTRDISYSILLSLAAVRPDIAQKSLLRKVRGHHIIQDTGTGGAWPVSTDRMTWALAAWEVYKVTGDEGWLKQAYAILKHSTANDQQTIVSPETGLMRGESSFLDWREQTYPRWMDPVDIFSSECLGTNAVHFQTYRILADMATQLGEPADPYRAAAERIKRGVQAHLWQETAGYYGQYRYGRHFLSLSPRAEGLGEALSVLFDLADAPQQSRIIEQTPVLAYGIPCIYPQIPGVPPYHNEAIWPFVQAYWTWAAAKTGHVAAVSYGLGAIYRAAALFVNNQENLVTRTGDFQGTVINSPRQLWSVAGNLAMVYRVLFGMDFQSNALVFRPFVPPAYAGTQTITDLHYRKSVLTVELTGHGSVIESVTLDGNQVAKAVIPSNLTGKHTLKIQLANQPLTERKFNLTDNYVSPTTPMVQKTKASITWKPVAGAVKYAVFRNGQLDTTTTSTGYRVKHERTYAMYQVMAIDEKGYESFKSAPVGFINQALVKIYQAEKFAKPSQRPYLDFTGNGFVELSKQQNRELTFKVTVVLPGTYLADFRYANGSGPLNTDNQCAIRTLLRNGQPVGAIVFPQRGLNEWSNWGYTNTYAIALEPGTQTLTLRFEDSNENMNGTVNTAMLDHLRLIRLR